MFFWRLLMRAFPALIDVADDYWKSQLLSCYLSHFPLRGALFTRNTDKTNNKQRVNCGYGFRVRHKNLQNPAYSWVFAFIASDRRICYRSCQWCSAGGGCAIVRYQRYTATCWFCYAMDKMVTVVLWWAWCAALIRPTKYIQSSACRPDKAGRCIRRFLPRTDAKKPIRQDGLLHFN